MVFNCLIAGTGGQGTGLMARIIGAAAIVRGFDVCGADSSAPARPGDSVESHIRLGQGIRSPLVPRGKADIVIALDPVEALRVYAFLSPAGRMLVLDRRIAPVPSASGERKYRGGEMIGCLRECLTLPAGELSAGKRERLIVIDGGALLKECGDSGLLNAALLGAAAEGLLLPVTADDIAAVLPEQILPGYPDRNAGAFNAGRKFSAEIFRRSRE